VHLSGGEFAVTFAALGLGALVQGSIGFGMNLVAVPIVALVAPEALPATLILVAFPLAVAMAVRERQAVHTSGVVWTSIGRLPGSILGAAIVVGVSAKSLSVVIGVSVVAAAALSFVTRPIPVTPTTATVAGFAGGVTGTAAAIGGPPMALLYQHHEGPTLRSTLAGTFAISTVMSVVVLAVAGQVHRWQIWLSIALVPAIALGLLASYFLHARLDAGWLRPAVLTFVAAAGVVAILNGIL
jgi:uncharacterized membrane protein YfcA